MLRPRCARYSESPAVRRPGDFAGAVVGLQSSGVAERHCARWADPASSASSSPLDGLDAYEQQLSAIESNGYDRKAGYVTSASTSGLARSWS